MRKQKLLVFLTLICIVALLVPFAASATETTALENGFSQDGNYYYRDGVMVTNEIVLHEGAYYAFDGSGWKYTSQRFSLNGHHYCAKEDGTLYAGEWYEENGRSFYYGEEGAAANDFLQLDGVWYYFDYEGEARKETAVWSDSFDGWYALSPDGNSDQRLYLGWNQAFGTWYYLVADAGDYRGGMRALSSEKREINGKLYFFEWNGAMLENDWASYSDLGTFRAKEDGSLYAGEWYQDPYGQWEYYGEDGVGAMDFLQINGTWYYFNGWSQMQQDRAVWSDDYQAWYALSANGEDHQRLVKGWNNAYGKRYYLDGANDWLEPLWGIQILDGKEYNFDITTNQLVTNQYVSYYSELHGRYVDAYANANGELVLDAWYQDEDGIWHYLQNGEQINNGVYNIGGKWYLFQWGELVTEPGEPDTDYNYDYRYYYVSRNDGQLYQNTWRYREIEYEYEIGWVYYGDDARMLENTAQKIGGVWYGFDHDGVMYENTIVELDGVTYRFGKDGKGTVLADGWYNHPEDNAWMYVKDGLLAEGILTIGGKPYGFQSGYMVSMGTCYGEYNGVWGEFLFDINGEIITRARAASGWYQLKLLDNVYTWLYVKADNTLAYGEWVSSGGKWYYMDPEMVQNRVIYEEAEKLIYVADANGVCTPLRGNGLHTVNSTTVYLENGKAVVNAWRLVNGYWYYFDEYGVAYRSGTHYVGENLYYFDEYGKLAITGWVSNYGDWYYADPNNDGILVTGLQTIGGSQYIFSNYGWMYSSGIYYYEGTPYLLATDGRVVHTFAEGWNLVGSDWYYVQDGSLLESTTIEYKGDYYGFDYDGVMLSGGVHYIYGEKYVFDADGRILTGWQKVDGKWYYADPDNMWLSWGQTYVNGKQYIFGADQSLMIGTFTYGGWVYTTDSDGAVTKETAVPEGWYYENGYWYYNTGRSYTGWLGDYYIRNNEMVFCDVVEYDGKLYYLQSNGLCLRNGWGQYISYYNFNPLSWVLARADGSLYCSQWVQQNGIWYYFDGCEMVADTTIYIDGELHEFDADGKWLGVYEEELADVRLGLEGWQQIGGKWYYYTGGYPTTGEIYDNGKYYLLDSYTGEMAENCIASWGYYDQWYYYGSDGARRNYVGWTLINGSWYYFNPDHTVYFGLVKDSTNKWCYTRLVYDDKADKYYSEQVFNEYIVVGYSLYYFDRAGYSPYALGGTGWYQANGDWYYLENGSLLRETIRTIGNAVYAFNYDGTMVADEKWLSDDGYLYFGADGKLVTKQGWYQRCDDLWVYVNADGYLYDYGIYNIGGKEYAFVSGIWIP